MLAADDYKTLKVGTVEEFQGDERHIILVSTVRTTVADTQMDADRRLGFIKCKNRINVAASRARYEPNWILLQNLPHVVN